jgi:hypothetical protein
MVGQILPNNNGSATRFFQKKICNLNTPIAAAFSHMQAFKDYTALLYAGCIQNLIHARD